MVYSPHMMPMDVIGGVVTPVLASAPEPRADPGRVLAATKVLRDSPQIAVQDVQRYLPGGMLGVGIGAGGPMLAGLAKAGTELAGGSGLGGAVTAGVGTGVTAYAMGKATDLAGSGGEAVSNGTTQSMITSGGYPAMYGIAGPGVPEPANGTWSKRWSQHVNSHRLNATWEIFFWQMWDGYTLMYNPMTQGWKRYKPRKNIVLSSDPRISNIARATRATEGKLKRLAKRTRRLQYKA